MNKQTFLKHTNSKIFEAVRVNAELLILVVLNFPNGATLSHTSSPCGDPRCGSTFVAAS